MHGEEYGGPGSLALVTISIVFAWISKLTMDQIAFVISALSGVLACISFSMRILSDLKNKKNTEVYDEVDTKLEQNGHEKCTCDTYPAKRSGVAGNPVVPPATSP
jgi:hypothetical protein